MDIYDTMITDIKLIKKTKDLFCFSYKKNEILMFSKIFFLENNHRLKEDYDREVFMNNYLKDTNLVENKKYFSELIEIHENSRPLECFLKFIPNHHESDCNILIFEHAGNHTLRYYINRVSQKKFDDLLAQLKEATRILQDLHIIHYDLYCESNIMVKKVKNKHILKIIDFGLSYIDKSDKTNRDYHTAIESIQHFNKKHICNI
jgi:RIO-like serine/threonine protein kinase